MFAARIFPTNRGTAAAATWIFRGARRRYQQPSYAVHAVGGSAVGAAVGAALGAPGAEIVHGLWGFNSALTALAVSVFFEPSPHSYALAGGAAVSKSPRTTNGRRIERLAGGGAAATAVAFAGLKTAMGTALAVPALTLPFCAVASACYLLHAQIPGLRLRS